MNANLRTAMKHLRPSDIERMRVELDIMIGSQGDHETNAQYAIRFLRKVEGDGKIRELELEMLRFK